MTADVTLEHSLPYNLEAERAVLGAILLDDKSFPIAAQLLRSDHFYLEAHRIIFQRMLDLHQESKPIDFTILHAELRRHEEDEKAGGPAYLTSLTDGLPRAVNVAYYAELIREAALSREMISISNEMQQRCFGGEEKSAEVLEGFQARLLQLSASQPGNGWHPMRDITAEGFRELDERSKNHIVSGSLESGLCDLDRMTGGFRPGNLILIAGRPCLGKTSLCLNITAHLAIRKRKRVAVISLEMSCGEVYDRMVSAEARVDLFRLRNAANFLSSTDWSRISRASGLLHDAPIQIDDAGSATIVQIRSKAERLHQGGGLDILIVDYLGLVSGSARRYNTKTEEISEISRALKLLAKQLKIPVIAACQLNREVEKRTSNKPQLSDLRDSGSLEQDADLVLMLWRDPRQPSEAEILIRKQRNGPVGEVALTWLPQWTRFVDKSDETESRLPYKETA